MTTNESETEHDSSRSTRSQASVADTSSRESSIVQQKGSRRPMTNPRAKSGRVSKIDREPLRAVDVFEKFSTETSKIRKALVRAQKDLHQLQDLMNKCRDLPLIQEVGPLPAGEIKKRELLLIEPAVEDAGSQLAGNCPKEAALRKSPDHIPSSSDCTTGPSPGQGTAIDEGAGLNEAELVKQYYAKYCELHSEVSASIYYAGHPKVVRLMEMHERLSAIKSGH